MPSSMDTLGDIQIKIKQEHRAPETMSSGYCVMKNEESQFQSSSVERLSKVSPYF